MQRARIWVTAGLLGVALCGCSSLTGGSGSGGAGKESSTAGATADGPEVPAFAADLERVCADGLGYSGMPAYDRKKKTVHPAVLMTTTGDLWSQSEPSDGDVPKGWFLGYAGKVAKAELLVCVERTKATPTGKVCRMEADGGGPLSVRTYNTSYRLRVVETRTGKDVYEDTGEATSDECPTFMFTSEGEDEDKYYNEVEPKDYRKRIQPFIAP